MTVMELLDPQDGWVLLWGLTGRDAEEALSAALERLEVAHSSFPGGVHGDLRDANVLVRLEGSGGQDSSVLGPSLIRGLLIRCSAVSTRGDLTRPIFSPLKVRRRVAGESNSCSREWDVRFIDFEVWPCTTLHSTMALALPSSLLMPQCILPHEFLNPPSPPPSSMPSGRGKRAWTRTPPS